MTWDAFWALLSASAAEVWLSTVALADGAGAYAVLITGLFIVEAGYGSIHPPFTAIKAASTRHCVKGASHYQQPTV